MLHIISYHIMSCHVMSYHVMPIPYHIITTQHAAATIMCHTYVRYGEKDKTDDRKTPAKKQATSNNPTDPTPSTPSNNTPSLTSQSYTPSGRKMDAPVLPKKSKSSQTWNRPTINIRYLDVDAQKREREAKEAEWRAEQVSTFM